MAFASSQSIDAAEPGRIDVRPAPAWSRSIESLNAFRQPSESDGVTNAAWEWGRTGAGPQWRTLPPNQPVGEIVQIGGTDAVDEAFETSAAKVDEASSPAELDGQLEFESPYVMPAARTEATPTSRSTLGSMLLPRTAQLPPQPAGDNEQIVPPEETQAPPDPIGRIRNILPYGDYEPDARVAADDPCMNQCPRPDGVCPPADEQSGNNLCPQMVQLSDSPYEGRLFGDSVFCWQASDLWYNPLYFEDAPLERYGHTCCCAVQPFVSAGKYSAQLLFIPYQMSIDPICKCVYPLGWYRPGECAPKKCYQPPLNLDAAVTTAGFYTGMSYIFP